MKKFSAITVIFLSGSFVSGCASIVGSTTQAIAVNTYCGGEFVTGATCTLTNDKGTYFVNTPGAALVNKADSLLTISCVKNGVKTPAGQFQADLDANIVGNLLFGGPIGVIVDAATGAGLRYPDGINVWWGEESCKEVMPGR